MQDLTETVNAIRTIRQHPREEPAGLYATFVTTSPGDPDPAEVMSALDHMPAQEDYFRFHHALARTRVAELTEQLKVVERAVVARLRRMERDALSRTCTRALEVIESHAGSGDVLRAVRDVLAVSKAAQRPVPADVAASMVDEDPEVRDLRRELLIWREGSDLLGLAVEVLNRRGMSAHALRDMLDTLERAVGWLSDHPDREVRASVRGRRQRREVHREVG